MSIRASLFTSLAITACILSIPAATARTIYVDDDGPADFNNIQAAIDDANDGDTVLVADGTYTGDGNRDIDFLGKAITVRSENGPEACIIDCQASYGDPHRGFYFHLGEGANSVVQGFTITNGFDGGWDCSGLCSGGGIYCLGASPTIANNIIMQNDGNFGGGIYCRFCSPVITNNTITGNWGDTGGGIYCESSSPVIKNNVIANNWGNSGGGIACMNESSLIIENNIIADNRASPGAGIYCVDSQMIVRGNTIEHNVADGGVGGIGCIDSSATIVNNLIVGNDAGDDFGGGISSINSTLTITNCTIANNTGGGIWDSDQPGQTHLNGNRVSCPANGYWIGIGPMTQSHPMGFLSVDQRFRNLDAIALTGDPITITNCIIRDNGPWPIGPGITVHYSNVEGHYEGVGNIDADPCFVDPGYAINWPELWVSGDYHLQSQAGRYDPNTQTWVQDPNTSPCIDAGDPGYGAGSGETDLDGRPRIIGGRIDMGAYEYQPPRTLYVDADATGANDGTNWENAYYYLQDALMFAAAGDEIRVAQGVYRPDDFVLSDRPSLGRAETFQLIDGVTLKGGYAGLGEADPNARNIELYETILSGDLDSNDVELPEPCDLIDDPSRAENCYHVVTAIETDNTAVIDGFIVTGGNADSPFFPNGNGGGMYNCSGSPIVANCRFIHNHAGSGGGGLIDINGAAMLRECTFIENAAIWGGGGATAGGNSIFQDCIFVGNYALECGGGFGNQGSSGCDPNSFSSFARVTSCTFSRNSAPWGGGLASYDNGGTVLTNCILWDNTPTQIYQDCINNTVVSYSCIQDTWPGEANIDLDPLFADLTPGDCHLKSKAGRWDPNDRRWTMDEVTSPCIDAGDPMSPIGYEPFPNGGIINMGAYGGTAEASKSYFGGPPCEIIVAGDVNGDCEINFLDFRLMALHWCEDHNL